jgi:hypothetical protein
MTVLEVAIDDAKFRAENLLQLLSLASAGVARIAQFLPTKLAEGLLSGGERYAAASSGGRSRLPTWSARKGGLGVMAY